MRAVQYCAVLAFWLFSHAVFSNEDEAAVRVDRYHVRHTLNLDGSNIRTYAWVATVLKEAGVESVKQNSITYSTSVERAEVVEAYTQKPDGRKFAAPRNNFQITSNEGRGKDKPAFSDWTTLTVVFPEVAVGDTVVFSYRITQTEAIFPGHVSLMETFPRSQAVGDMKITIDAPVGMKARHEVRGMQESSSSKGNRQILELSMQNKSPVRDKRMNYSVYDPEQEPGYIYSTFQSYAELAEAYGSRARGKAAVTLKVRGLADEIAKGKTEPREVARSLYEWVATNITFSGNCVGVGVVVPRDLSVILENKMGDCKDHATLLQALLAAKGIESTQALVSSGNIYSLPKLPVIASVNHVINYIPNLDVYLDATAGSIPFGMLPFSVAGKPVLLVDGFKEGARTPVAPIGADQQRLKSTLDIGPDGTATGDIEIWLKGMYAVNTRAVMRQITKEQEADVVKNVLQGAGLVGSGRLEKDDPTALIDTYRFKVSLTVQGFLQRPGAGAFNIVPLFSTDAPVHRFAWNGLVPEESVDIACTSGKSVEEYVYRFPAGVQILSIPDNMDITEEFLTYRATYSQKEGTLTAERMFDDRTKGNICSPAVMSIFRGFTAKVRSNIKSQVLYK